MFQLIDTHVYSGHTRHGPPPVVRFRLGSTVSSRAPPEVTTAATRLRALGLTGKHVRELADSDDLHSLTALFASALRELLHSAGHPAGAVSTEPHDHEANACIYVPCADVVTCEGAGRLVAGALVGDRDQKTLASDRASWLSRARKRRPDPNAQLLCRAAEARGLPIMRLDQPPMETRPDEDPLPVGLIHVGHGVHGHSFAVPLPSTTDGETVEALADRHHVVSRLVAAGVPVARQDLEFPNKRQPRRAVRAARRLGFPVVVRPVVRPAFSYRRSALAIHAGLHTPDAVERAFEAAAGAERAVWVEGQHPGTDHRFLIVNGRVHAVARCRPPTVQGDGHSSVAALIAAQADAATEQPERLGWLSIARGDHDVAARLALAGMDWTNVPGTGQRLTLRGVGTPYNGGTCQDVTATVSDDIKRTAEAAAAACGVTTLAGVDMAIVSLSGPATTENCAVLDVLPDPDLLSHADATADAAAALLGALIPEPSARVPLCSITGTNGKTTTTQMVAHILRQAGDGVAVATTQGTAVDDERVATGDLAGITGASQVLTDHRTRVAVLETARGGLIKLGAPYDHSDVGVCLNVQEDHIGVDGVDTLDQMAAVKGEVIRRTTGAAVLNADDPRSLDMRRSTPAREIILVAETANDAVLDHCLAGGRALLVSGGGDPDTELVLCQGERRMRLMTAAEIPASLQGRVHFNAVNAAFAAAAAFRMGLDAATIRAGLATFDSTYDRNPGRMNVFEGAGYRVIVDYAHNPNAVLAFCSAVERMAIRGQRTLVIGGPGDRTDAALERLGRMIAGRFDRYICMSTTLPGKREPDEIPRLVHRGLLSAGTPPHAVDIVASRGDAVETALDRAANGDLVTIIAGTDLDDVCRRVRARMPSRAGSSQPDSPPAPG